MHQQGVEGFECVLDESTGRVWEWCSFRPDLVVVNDFEGMDQLMRGEAGRSCIEPRGFRVVQIISWKAFGNTVVDGSNCGSGARSLEDKWWIPTSPR